MKEVWVVYNQDYDCYDGTATYLTEEAALKKLKRLHQKHIKYTNFFPKTKLWVVSHYDSSRFDNGKYFRLNSKLNEHNCNLNVRSSASSHDYYSIKKLEVLGA